MDEHVKFHLERLKAATIEKLSLANIPEWITKNTSIKGQPYSFLDHEYQERILRDQSQETVTRKCSQVGLSEVTARKALALCGITRGYTVAYTLPTAGFAATFMRTRIDPIIDSSPYLKDQIHSSTDNSEVKRFEDSYLYLKGCQSDNAPISVPCDHLIHDEIDFSDPTVISQYQSRITHSAYKRKDKLSTPTLPNRGIDYEFQRSRRHFNLVKCSHCNHWFIPDYYKHVRIPGSNVDLINITKNNLHQYDYKNAYVACEKCGEKVSTKPENREWVCENPSESYVAAGYQVTPFDCGLILPGFLIESSTQYKKLTDFVNFSLGLPAEDAESVLSAEELRNCIVMERSDSAVSYVMGLDIGMTSWCVIAAVTWDQKLVIVHTEGIPVANLRGRVRELEKQYRTRITVADALPFVETILAMQQVMKNLYAAIFMRSKSLETFNLKRKDEDEKEGIKGLRQVNINRDKAMDALMDAIRQGMVLKVADENDDMWVAHCTSMSRIKEWTPDAEMSYVWRKPESGEDHMWFATLFAHIASQIIGVSRNTGGVLNPILGTFKTGSKDVTPWPGR